VIIVLSILFRPAGKSFEKGIYPNNLKRWYSLKSRKIKAPAGSPLGLPGRRFFSLGGMGVTNRAAVSGVACQVTGNTRRVSLRETRYGCFMRRLI
jgi:hypothetical protein